MLDFQKSATTNTACPQKGLLRPLQQTEEFKRTLTACGHRPVTLPRMDGALVTNRRFLGRFNVAMINRAPLLSPDLLQTSLHEAGLSRRPVILSPDQPAPDLLKIGALPLITSASVALLDLSKPRDQLHAGLHQKWRNRVTRAQKNGVQTRRQNMPLDANHWLLTADQAQQRQRGYRNWPLQLTLAYARINKGQAKLFQAFEGKEVLAAILILCHGNTATYHISYSTPRGKKLNASNLLLWEAMNWLSSKGILQLDLGLINTEEAPGLARFKLGTGASLQQLGGTWLLWGTIGRLFSPFAKLDQNRMTATSD